MSEDMTRVSAKAPVFAFAILSILVTVIGYVIFEQQKNSIKSHIQEELAAIASLKASEISRWRMNLHRDAELLMESPMISLHVEQLLTDMDSTFQKGLLMSRLSLAKGHSALDRVALIGKDCTLLMSTEINDSLTDSDKEILKQSLKTNEIVFSDFHLNPNHVVKITVAVPVSSLESRRVGPPIAAFLMEVDPQKELFPIIQHWPTPSETAETLLVSRKDNDVVFLNTLRHMKNRPMELRRPIDNSSLLPAAMAVSGRKGVVEGIDYRGHPVVGSLMQVPGTQWFIVAKADTGEVLAPLRRFSLLYGLIVILLICLAFAGASVLWFRKNAVLTKRQLDTEIINTSLTKDLLRAETQYRQIVELAQDGICAIGSDRKITFVNKEMADMIGTTPDEMIGSDVFGYVVDKADFMHRMQLREKGVREQYDIEILHRDGSSVYAIVSASPVMVDGSFNGSIAFLKDITMRKLMEMQIQKANAALQKLSIAIEQGPSAIVITDVEGIVEYINPRFTEMTGYTQAEVIGHNPRILKSGLTPPKTYDALWKAITSGRKWQGEITNRKKDGGLYVEKMSISPIKDLSGCISGFVAVKEDITEKKMKESQLILYERQAKMGEMLGVIAHQWRQPLSAISAAANRLELETIMGGVEKDNLLETFNKIKIQIRHLSQTIDDFRSFLKPDTVRVKADVADIIQKSLRIIETHFESHGIDIQRKIKPDILVNTYADELVQVLLCIFENAKEAFEDRITVSPHIAIDVYEDDDYAVIEMEDNAGGIDPERFDKIFLPYFTTKAEAKGTGLGLYMAKMIVEDHCGGKISASNKGDGACFTIRIPMEGKWND